MSLVEQQFEARQERSHIHHDGDKLLQLAEDLQDRCEAYRQKSMFYMFLVVFAAITILGTISFAYEYYTTLTVSTFILAPMFSGAILGFGLKMYKHSLNLARRDLRALHSIVDMLREIEPALADQENMSALERAEFQIRLARFDIGPELQSSTAKH